MRAKVTWIENSVTVTSPPLGASREKCLHGIDVNMNIMPDVSMTMAVVSLFDNGMITIRDGEFHELLSMFQPHNSWLTVSGVLL